MNKLTKLRGEIFIGLILILSIISCKKKDQSINSAVVQDPVVTTPSSGVLSTDELTAEQIQTIEAAGVDSISSYKDAVFPDGTSMSNWEKVNSVGKLKVLTIDANNVSDKKRLFIDSMTHAGFYLINKKNFNSFLPQKGIAYVYNAKAYTTTTTFPGATCQTALHGLDCSGMIYQMAKASNLNLTSGGTIDYAKTTVWNTAFSNSSDFIGLQMTDLANLDPLNVQAGDIIVSPNNHIGMVFNNGKTLSIFNSLGRSSYACSKNSDTFHGPVISKDLTRWLKTSFGTNYRVLRAVLIGKPGLTTTEASSVTESSAISGGNITDEGSSPIIEKGVCWGLSQNPTITSDTKKKSDDNKTGNFSISISDLKSNTIYHLRAYATNSFGTSYGKDIIFIAASNQNALFAGTYVGTTIYTNYENNGADVKIPFEIMISVDKAGVVSGEMTISGISQIADVSLSGSSISIGWYPPHAPYKFTGIFSADKKTIQGTGGAGNYYAPLNANGPFILVKSP